MPLRSTQPQPSCGRTWNAMTISAMPSTPYPLADGLTFQCNKKQVSIAPNICSNAVLQTKVDAKGNGTKYTVLDGSTVLNFG